MSLVASNAERSQPLRCESEVTKSTWSPNHAAANKQLSTTRCALDETKYGWSLSILTVCCSLGCLG